MKTIKTLKQEIKDGIKRLIEAEIAYSWNSLEENQSADSLVHADLLHARRLLEVSRQDGK